MRRGFVVLGRMPVKPPTFRPRSMRAPTQRREADDQRRGSARERGYSARWDRESATFRRAHPLCLGCQAVERVEPSTVTDHIVPHKGDRGLLWDMANWQPCCAWHHDVVKQQLEQRWARGEIGPASLRLDSPEAVALTRDLDPDLGP